MTRWVSLFKRGAVLMNASVTIQQPSAILRATALINPKYFARMTAHPMKAYDEAMKYSGTAVIKEIGGFDTGMGSSAASWIMEVDPDNRFKGVFTDRDYREKLMGIGPQLTDRLTWGEIWNAVKNEVRDKTNLTGEELLIEAGKRFDEVINYTQVYDSVLARSANMRSKNGLMQMVTSFMAEPTTSFNMLADALAHINDKNYEGKVSVGRAAGAFIAASIFNAMLKGLVYAARDDDDKPFWEKYIKSITNSLAGDPVLGIPFIGGDLSPLTLVPILRDVVSIGQGWEVERADMSVIADLLTGVKRFVDKLQQGKDLTMKDWVNLAAGLNAVGIPAKNILRDYAAIKNVFDNLGRKTYGPALWSAALEGAGLPTPDALEQYMNAVEAGDTDYADYLLDSVKKTNAKAEYYEYFKNGYKEAMKGIEAKYHDEVEGWIREGSLADAKAALDAADSTAATKYVNQYLNHGGEPGSVKNAITGYMKPILQGAGSDYMKYAVVLGSLPLYKKNGDPSSGKYYDKQKIEEMLNK